MKRVFITVGILLLVLVFVAPYISYILIHQGEESGTFWGDYGKFVSGVLGPIVAIVGTLISYVIHRNNQEQNIVNIKRQEMLQRPLLFIDYWDGTNSLEINLRNKGIGPLIISGYKLVSQEDGEIKHEGIFQAIKGIGGTFDNYTGNQTNLVLSPDERRNLFKLSKRENTNPDFEEQKEAVRRIFKDLKIVINYKDIYGQEMEPYQKSLSWFGRNYLDNDPTKR